MTLEQMVTVSILCVWFAFPVGMFVAIMRQGKHQRYPKISVAPEKKHHHHKHPHQKNFVVNHVDKDGEYVDDEIPTIPAYQIPKKIDRPSHWKI